MQSFSSYGDLFSLKWVYIAMVSCFLTNVSKLQEMNTFVKILCTYILEKELNTINWRFFLQKLPVWISKYIWSHKGLIYELRLRVSFYLMIRDWQLNVIQPLRMDGTKLWFHGNKKRLFKKRRKKIKGGVDHMF